MSQFMSKLLLLTVLVSLVAIACGQSGAPATVATPGEKGRGEVARTAAEQDWDKLVAAAKKEGSLMLYGSVGTEIRRILAQAFQDKYGIILEYASFGRSADLVAKVQAENRAGLYVADVFMTGGTTLLSALRPAGMMRPVEPHLVLPEVLEPRLWRHGELYYLDKGKLVIPMLMSLQRGAVFINKDFIKENEIASAEDLLKPQYKGRIAMGDARVGGAASGLVAMLAYFSWDKEKTKNFLRGLSKQEVALTTNDQLLGEWVARGKYHIGLGASHTTISSLMALGAPLAPAPIKEGVAIISGSESIALPSKSPHANATTVFINWLLTKEGMTALSKATGLPTNRLDVPREGILPISLPQPAEKVYDDSEDFAVFRATVTRELAIEAFGAAR